MGEILAISNIAKLPGQTVGKLNSLVRRVLQPPAPLYLGPILPQRVRYAMNHGGAELSAKDIESLYFTGFRRAAFYLGIKAADTAPDVQASMLQSFGAQGFDYRKLELTDIQRGTEVLDSLPVTARRTVLGEKLAQLSRHGIEHELAAFDASLAASDTAYSTAPLFMVANYPYIALDVLARYSLKLSKPLGVINPDNIGDVSKRVGLLMEGPLHDLRVTELAQDYQMPAESTIFDDVIRHGTTRARVLNWAGEASVNFVTTGRVSAMF